MKISLLPLNSQVPGCISRRTGENQKLPFLENGANDVAVSPDGRLAATVGGAWGPEKGEVYVWKTGSGEVVTVLTPDERPHPYGIAFSGNDEILTANETVLRRWNLETAEFTDVYEGFLVKVVSSQDGRLVGVVDLEGSSTSSGRAILIDLDRGEARSLDTHGDQLEAIDLNAEGTIVATGGQDGVVRVGPATGEEPQLLFGHRGPISDIAFDPLGRWIASGGQDGTVRLWPMPDLSKPPLHTLPREELIAKLKTLTNLRVVRDEESATGWKLTHDPFPGWETVPTW